MRSFGFGQSESPGEGEEHLLRWVSCSALFELDDVVRGHSSEPGDLLAAQTRRPTAGTGGQPPLFGRQSVAPRSESRPQFPVRHCHCHSLGPAAYPLRPG
jgi:hypothetical protein